MIDLVRPILGEEEQQALLEVLASGQLAAGPRVQQFEREFAQYCGVAEAVATCNGTTALHAALHAVGVGPGDKVITTAFSFIATANAIRFCGAEPIFADIDLATFNLSPASLEETLHRHPDVKAVLVVHLFGLPADMDAIRALCSRRGVVLVEDCAQAHGARYKGKRVGGFGEASAFSFYATKNMTTGEGGMVVTDSSEVARRVRSFVNHGRSDRYYHRELGYNFRMTDLAAALGRVQLTRLDEWNRKRQEHARRLNEGLASLDWLVTPTVPAGCEHVYHQYTIRTPYRDQLAEWLKRHEIGCGIIYPLAIHQQPAYARAGAMPSLPRAEQAAREVLSLPVHPALSDADLETIIDTVRRFQPR